MCYVSDIAMYCSGGDGEQGGVEAGGRVNQYVKVRLKIMWLFRGRGGYGARRGAPRMGEVIFRGNTISPLGDLGGGFTMGRCRVGAAAVWSGVRDFGMCGVGRGG